MAAFQKACDFLYSLKQRGSKYGIERMRRFMQQLGQPQENLACIHVAGTNGKGSTCAMLEAIYRANGYKTGLYSSPHLVYLGERIQINREAISEAKILEYCERLKSAAQEISHDDPDQHPSFFEFMTAMALLYFAEQKVDIALIETGLGGRLDATNILMPQLSVITSIGLDHTEILGDSIAAIAREKAGIIKAGVPVVIGALPAEANIVMREVAAQQQAPLQALSPRLTEFPSTNLAGSFQAWNAALALLAVQTMQGRWKIEPHLAKSALRSVQWKGRWDRRRIADYELILDATHNAQGARHLEKNLQALLVDEGTRPIIIAACSQKDRAESLMRTIAPYAKAIHLIQLEQEGSASRQFLRDCLQANEVTCPVLDAQIDKLFPKIGHCSLAKPQACILVTGSIYLVGAVLEKFEQATIESALSFQD
ncbi:MAG: bifunctional folylpolyglutamate synthase/dihydrofolate synthase [Opitutales bacterium]